MAQRVQRLTAQGDSALKTSGEIIAVPSGSKSTLASHAARGAADSVVVTFCRRGCFPLLPVRSSTTVAKLPPAGQTVDARPDAVVVTMKTLSVLRCDSLCDTSESQSAEPRESEKRPGVRRQVIRTLQLRLKQRNSALSNYGANINTAPTAVLMKLMRDRSAFNRWADAAEATGNARAAASGE